MKRSILTYRITFVEPLLGSASGNRALHEEFIASKAPTVAQRDEEAEAVPVPVEEQVEKASTIFPRDDKGLFLWDYQVRGFFKEAIGCLIELGDITKISKWGYKKAVDSFLFVTPRRIYLRNPDGAIWTQAPETLQRPLRAETMQGERVALARSEMLPAGTSAEFRVTLLQGSNSKSKVAALTPEDVEAALEYGALKGFGQWRSGGFGRMEYVQITDTAPTVTEPEKEVKAFAA